MPRPFARSIRGCILTLGVRGRTNDPTISNCALQQNEALDDLSRSDTRLVRVVEPRHFVGLNEDEIAASLGVTQRTVRRDSQKARLLPGAAPENRWRALS
jgi:DNA-directed RNA polymerase specialized sigma24 family protein